MPAVKELWALSARDSDTTPSYPDENRKGDLLAIVATFLGSALLSVLGRLYVRIFMLRTMGVDDWCMVVAMLLGIGVMICVVGETRNGMGSHYTYITDEMLSRLYHWQFFHSILVMLAVSFVKVSIACFLLRLVPSKNYRRFFYGMIVFLAAYSIMCAMTIIFYCIPVSAQWDFSLTATAKCYNFNTYVVLGIFNSSINIVTDVIFAVLPIPMVLNLQVNRRTKITLVFILSLGLFACAAAIVKTVYQSQFTKTPDWFYDDFYMTWNIIELSVGILSSCLPTLRPLFASILGTTRALTGSASRSRGKSRTTGGSGIKLTAFNKSKSNSQHFKKSGYYMQNSDTEVELTMTNRGPAKTYQVQISTQSHPRHQSESKSSISANDKDLSADDSSEDGILPLQTPNNIPGKNQIVRTTEVTIH